MELLQHPNVVPYYSYEKTGIFHQIIMGLADESLAQIIRRTKLTEEEIKPIVRTLVKCLAHLEAKQVLWLDMKPDNILMKGGQALITDFGLSIKYDELYTQRIRCGTVGYMPPEISVDYCPRRTSDVYCLGATVFSMLTRKNPCEATMFKGLWRAEVETNISKELLCFLTQALCLDADLRPSAQQLLHHRWLN